MVNNVKNGVWRWDYCIPNIREKGQNIGKYSIQPIGENTPAAGREGMEISKHLMRVKRPDEIR
jgi:hypothetical protein